MGLKLHTREIQAAAVRGLPADLLCVALIDANTCAAAGGMSVSWWHEAVRAGKAPAAAIRKPRCTRWRLADVQAFWRAFAEVDTSESAAKLTADMTRASKIAWTKRRQQATEA